MKKKKAIDAKNIAHWKYSVMKGKWKQEAQPWAKNTERKKQGRGNGREN